MIVLYVFNATFNNILTISWCSVLLVEESGAPWKITSSWKPEYLKSNLELILLQDTTERLHNAQPTNEHNEQLKNKNITCQESSQGCTKYEFSLYTSNIFNWVFWPNMSTGSDVNWFPFIYFLHYITLLMEKAIVVTVAVRYTKLLPVQKHVPNE